jgi:RNA polymerase sigma-70 factor, ECF subfamily
MARADERPDADRYLVDRIRKGDEDAWEQLIARYQGRLAAFARRKLGGGAEPEDVVQEAFVGFLQSLGGYDKSRSLETFLFTILRHCLLRAYRKTAAAEAMGFDPLDDSGSGPGLEDSGE